MKRFYDIRRIAALLLAVTPVLGLWSCSDGGDAVPPGKQGGEVFLRFTLATRRDGDAGALRSRAADTEGDLEGSGYENRLNVDDLQYLLFDGESRFLGNFSASAETVSAGPDGTTVYLVTARLDADYFDRKLPAGGISFHILALANHSDWGIAFADPARGTAIGDFLDGAAGLPMTRLPNATRLLRAEGWEWQPGGLYFPMAGWQRFDISGSMLSNSSESNPYDLTAVTGKELNLLRALAKIELIDRINIGERYDEAVDGDYFASAGDPDRPNSWLRIAKAEINGIMSRGTLLPSIDEWINADGDETQQVDAPTVPASALYNRPPLLPDDNELAGTDGYGDCILDFAPDPAATQRRADKCPVFSAYLFEYDRFARQLAGLAAGEQPYIRVTTQGGADGKDGGLSAESMLLPLRIAAYKNGTAAPADNLKALLRNHIYRFEITGISQNLQINWTVCDMSAAEAEIEFN